MSKVNQKVVLELAPELLNKAQEQLNIVEEMFSADFEADVYLPTLNLTVPSVDKRLHAKYIAIDNTLAELDVNVTQLLDTKLTAQDAANKALMLQATDDIAATILQANTDIQNKLLELAADVATTITHLNEDADDIIVNLDDRMITIEQAAANIKTILENKVIEVESRVRGLETSNAEVLVQQGIQVDNLESRIDTALLTADDQIQAKLVNIQTQLNSKFTQFDIDVHDILEGAYAPYANQLTNPVPIHGVDFDGSQGIDIPEFSSEKSGVVPKRTSNRTDTFLGEDGTWKNPTANITAMIGNANGLATLDDAGKIPSEQLPSYVDDVLEFPQATDFPNPGETGKIYIDKETNTTHRWTGTAYVKITSGEVSSVAGRRGVVTLTKEDVALSNVDNTSDADKPISTATQAALDSKPSKAVATDTANGLMASTDKGKLDGIEEGANKYVHPTLDGYLHVPATGTTNANKVLTAGASEGSVSWVSLSKSSVGLGKVDNTADIDKSVKHANTAGALASPVSIQGTLFDGQSSIELPVFSNLVDGLVPKRSGATDTKYLREDGTWVAPPDTKYTALTEALALEGIDADAHLITAALLKAAINKHAPKQTDIEGNAATASKLKNKVTINGVEFDGASNIEIRTGSSAFIGSVTWFNGNYMKMPDGYQQANGQVYNRADYPELWLAISTGQYESITDSVWLATPKQRGKYSTGDGSTTFRMPDLNGALADSIKAPVLRGNGGGTVAGETKTIGQIDVFAIPEHKHNLITGRNDSGNYHAVGSEKGHVGNGYTASYDAGDSWIGAVTNTNVATENRMNSVYGLWIVKVRNDTSSVGYTAPATLMHNEYNGNQIVNGDVIIRGNIVIKDTAGVRVDLPLGFIEWFNGKRTAIRLGTLPADGLLLKRTDYPALWAEIANGGFEAITETAWQATPAKRGCYSTGDGSTTFRLPDLNGVQTGSIKAPVLRGDGGGTVAGEAKTIGQMDTDAIRDIEGDSGTIHLAQYNSTKGTGALRTEASESGMGAATNVITHPKVTFKASRVVPTAPENRMNSVYGIWIIRVNGGVPNTAAGTGATLESNTFNGSQKVVGDLDVSGVINASNVMGTAIINCDAIRLVNTTYINDSSRIRKVRVAFFVGAASTNVQLLVGGRILDHIGSTAWMSNSYFALSAEVPKGVEYKLNVSTGSISSIVWSEI